MMRAVFIDKDGTLIENVPYNVDPELLVLASNAGSALRLFRQMGYRLFVISNQAGVARGLFDEAALAPLFARLAHILEQEQVTLDGVYYCPHHPHGVVKKYTIKCDCRKPHPGMLQRAAWEHDVSLSGSWMVGDILDDVEAGRRAGCCTVLIDNGNETEWALSPARTPHLIVTDLLGAALAIQRLDRRLAMNLERS
jgi:D-glycero-D-manno-heptose 1,7-bisphosphate phosphatase